MRIRSIERWSLSGLIAALVLGAGGLAPVRGLPDVMVYMPAMMKRHLPGYESPMGIAMFGGVSDATGLAAMKAAGSTWVMTDLNWSVVQPVEGGPYDWSSYDTSFSNAAAAGLSIYLLVDSNPAWVTSGGRQPIPADKLPAFQAFVQAAAQRYNGLNGQPRINYGSFFGEPDNQAAWGNASAAYADMLAGVAPLVHAANPTAKVLIGGLAYDWFTDDEIVSRGPGPFVRGFLAGVLQRLAATGALTSTLDAFAFHFYPISPERWPTLREKTQELRGILTQYGVGNLPILVPEVSIWSVLPNQVEDQHAQATVLIQNFARALAVGVRQVFWFQVFDVPDNPNITSDNTTRTQGLFVEQNLSQPKQSYTAYQVLARELDQWLYASALNVSGAEGYVFNQLTAVKTVAWGTSTAGPTPLNFAQTCARMVSALGVETTLRDGQAGDLGPAGDGQIRLQVNGGEPIYVGPCP